METSACRLGLRDWAAAATSGAEPIPDSFEKSPRAIPNLQAEAIVLPIKPPPAARGVNAAEAIVEIVCAITSAFIINIIRQPNTYKIAIKGTSFSDTFVIDFTPPMIATPTKTQRITAMT